MPARRRVPPQMLRRARALRRDMSRVERVLWSQLRGRGNGMPVFRRQHVIGPYVVDFYCPAAKLVIELDGRSHESSAARDEARTRFIEAAGCRVIRFYNEDVLTNLPDVLRTIEREMGRQ